MPTLSEQQAAASTALTQRFKAQQNRDAARLALLISLYYQTRVNVEDPASIEAWLDLMIPRLIRTSDDGANSAAAFYRAVRMIEAPTAQAFTPTPSIGVIDEGVRKSLLTVGPYAYTNKARDIRSLSLEPQQEKALLVKAKASTTQAIAGAVIRHTQAGGRQTIYDNTEKDKVALGWVRVTRAKPCFFCAMLASRGLRYRTFKEGSFDLSNAQFTGDGDAKVHDGCGCSLKPVYFKTDPSVKATDQWADMWSRWGAGGGDSALRFRRGYDHWAKTGEFLDYDEVAA